MSYQLVSNLLGAQSTIKTFTKCREDEEFSAFIIPTWYFPTHPHCLAALVSTLAKEWYFLPISEFLE